MGFDSHSGTIQTKEETIVPPNGMLFGCTTYDNINWHWCDLYDGYWLDESLDSQGTDYKIVQVQCHLKNNQVPKCAVSKYLYV